MTPSRIEPATSQLVTQCLNQLFFLDFLVFLTLEDGADRLSRNVSRELTLYAT